MKDIPRNELLDKLSAGWKVRRKGWDDASMLISKDYGSNSRQVGWWELLKDDWEGESGLPQLYLKNVSAQVAFRQLKSNATKFICRTAWPAPKQITFIRDNISLSIDDVLADDWEVWD